MLGSKVVEFELEPGTRDKVIDLVLARGACISGEVLGAPHGEHRWVRIHADFGEHVEHETMLEEDDTFRLPVPPHTTFSLYAMDSSEEAQRVTNRVQVQSGGVGIQLRFGIQPRIRGRIVDSATHASVAAHVDARSTHFSSHEMWERALESNDGAFDLELPGPCVCRLLARTADGHIGIVGPIDASSGRDVSDLEIAVEPAAELVVTDTEPHDLYLLWRGGLFVQSFIADGESRLVPAGVLTITEGPPFEGPTIAHEVHVGPGESTTVSIDD